MRPLRPYLYHAYYNWILDNDYTPYLLVNAEYPNVDVPNEFVKEGKIVLNLSPRSIGQYSVDEEGISFSARFQGILRDIYLPFGSAVAIYAQETGDGTMFQDEAFYLEENYLARIEAVSEREKVVVKKKSKLKLVK